MAAVFDSDSESAYSGHGSYVGIDSFHSVIHEDDSKQLDFVPRKYNEQNLLGARLNEIRIDNQDLNTHAAVQELNTDSSVNHRVPEMTTDSSVNHSVPEMTTDSTATTTTDNITTTITVASTDTHNSNTCTTTRAKTTW